MTVDLADLLLKAGIPVLVLVTLVFLRKRFRISPARMSAAEVERLDQRFGKIKWIPPLCMIAIGILFVVGTHAALSGLNQYFATRPPSDFQLLPQPAIWWFFPGFGALCLSWEITLQLWALMGDRRTVNLYSDWSNLTSTMASWGASGFDSRKVLRIFSLVIALPIGLLTVLAIPMHSTVGPDTIRDCGYGFKGCQVYSLSDARRITAIEGFRTRDGELTARAGLVVDFRDGRRWSSAEWGDFKREVDPALSSFLSAKTGLPIDTAPTEEDIPPMH